MIAAMFLTALALLLLGCPLWVLLVVSSAVGMLVMDMPVEIAVRAISGSLDNYVLLAVPGFIFVGELFARSSMAEKLIAWVESIVGWVPGSMPVATIATSEMFGAISGSSPATVAALGRTLYPGLRSRGYGVHFSLGLITSSGAIAIVIPPSIAMILYAVTANTSVADLFLAGVVPGILIGVALALYGLWYTLRHVPRAKRSFSMRSALRSSRAAGWVLGAPVIIFGGIYGGVLTPTEAAGAAAVYVAIVAVAVERSLGVRALFEVTRDAALLTSKIFVIVAAAGLFSYVITIGGVPARISQFVSGMELSSTATMLAIIAALLVVGMFLEPTSAMLVFTPLLLPLAVAQGVDPIHFGLVMTVGLAIGMFTPPFGLNLFVSQSIFGVSAGTLARSIIPFAAINIALLMLIAFVPILSLWLPQLVG